MRRAFLVLVTTLILGIPPPAGAAANTAVAVPGSFMAGYATPVLVLSRSAPATFANLDIADHDVRSVETGPSAQPYFSSPIIEGGRTATIDGLTTTPEGIYEFFCILHPIRMRGTAIVIA